MRKVSCPTCEETHVIKKGKRKTRYTVRQIYYCKKCEKKFTEGQLMNKTYSPGVIFSAISYYNMGHTLKEASKLVNRRFKVKTSKSSLHSWIDEFSDVCSFGKIRNTVLKGFENEVVATHAFEHQGLEYAFTCHKAKLKSLASNQKSSF